MDCKWWVILNIWISLSFLVAKEKLLITVLFMGWYGVMDGKYSYVVLTPKGILQCSGRKGTPSAVHLRNRREQLITHEHITRKLALKR